MTGQLVNPTKVELISLLNLVWQTPQMNCGSLTYGLEENNSFRGVYTVNDRTRNLQILNHLSVIDYSKDFTDIQTFIKKNN
jgi:hypothetical protein